MRGRGKLFASRRGGFALPFRVLVTSGVAFASLVVGASPAWAPTDVQIGDAPTRPGGTSVKSGDIANALTSTSVVIQATTSITIVDDADLSVSTFGDTPIFDLTLRAPVINISKRVIMAAEGNLFLTATTVNLTDRINSGGTLIDPFRVRGGTASQVNVLSNTASVQQAIDVSSHTLPVNVQVSAGQHAEDVTIDHALTLSGNDGLADAGADPAAPTLSGTTSSGNVITVTSNSVGVHGFRLDGTVNGGASTASVDGVFASGVDGLTVQHNTLSGFSGSGIEAPNSTNVTVNANVILPTAITSADTTTFTQGSAGTFTVTSTGTPLAALSETGVLPSGVTFIDNGDGTATLAGTPGAGTAGTYPLSVTADNGFAPPATQSFTLTVDPPAHAPKVIGGCSGQVSLWKFTPSLTDQTQDGVKAAGALAKDQNTKAPIGGTCDAPVRPGDPHVPAPSGTLHPKAEAISLLGNASCANTTDAQTADTNRADAWPLNGKITFTMNENYTDLLSGATVPYKLQADIAELGNNPNGIDTINVGGIVLTGLAPGATVTGTLWQDPVTLTHGPSGYNTGYELNMNAAANCGDNSANNATISQALTGGGTGQPSLVGTTNATGLTFTTGE